MTEHSQSAPDLVHPDADIRVKYGDISPQQSSTFSADAYDEVSDSLADREAPQLSDSVQEQTSAAPHIQMEQTEHIELTNNEADESDESASDYAASAPGGGRSSRNSFIGHSASRSFDAGTPTALKTKIFDTSNASAFLSTLKSKAADKQALSNSAKETMRKWGVNWGGLRKESSGGDELPDHGSTRSEGSQGQKSRASYAEVRAAVAERKERERVTLDEETTLHEGKRRSVSGPQPSRISSEGISTPQKAATEAFDHTMKPVAPIHVQPH